MTKITPEHLTRGAYIYIRQSTVHGPEQIATRGRLNSPPEAGSNRHLRPVNSPPLTAGTEPLGEAEPSLTNNPIWQA